MTDFIIKILSFIDHTSVYKAMLFFYGVYPVFMAQVWMVLSLVFRARQEGSKASALREPFPFVTFVIAAYGEESTLGKTLESLLALEYPNYEVLVVNDGSLDGTADVVRQYIGEKVRLLDKKTNEGKAMALNDALPACQGEILLVLDADIIVSPRILDYILPHFNSPRVAAVTGNPRVLNRHTLLQNLQAIEFSAIISMQRRAQRIWGRVMTVSGAVVALRRSALLDVGLFAPEMATEDIELTWRLQKKFWDVRYEPRAVVWMQVPPTLRELWKQRRRWALGLAQVLKKHRNVPTRWTLRRLWPVFYESIISVCWAYTFTFITLYWLVCLAVGYPALGASPIPNFWGMTIAAACITQLFVGALTDRRYDRKLLRSFPEIIYYPLVYWMLMSTITSIYTLKAFVVRQPVTQRWKIARRPA